MRVGALGLTVLLACAAAAGPAQAAHGHHLRLYKVERHVDLDGEGSTYTVTCPGNDLALDGMWRIDSVDQDPEFTRLELLRSVYVIGAYPTSDSSYAFEFTPVDGGDVQVKLWTTCLGNKTESVRAHTHSFPLSVHQADFFVPATPASPIDYDHTTQCPLGSVAVQPGFRRSDDGLLIVNRSWFAPNFRGWHWGFVVPDGPAAIHMYVSCLPTKSTPAGAGPHAHNLVAIVRPGYGGSQRFVPIADNRQDEALHCGDQAKGMVGGWWVDDPFHTWFFGMEPQIKSRVFWFGSDGGGSNSVYVSLLCINDRTSKAVAP